jgi:hypothetical protein
MPVLIYSADLREADGELMTATDVSDNFSDIESVANALDWMNIQGGSLDTYHMADGEPAKLALGRFDTKRPVYQSTWTDVVSHSIPVSAGDGVFAVASVTYQGAYIGGKKSNVGRIKISGSYASPLGGSVPIGERKHTHMDNPEVHGHGGIVWAYQVTENTMPSAGNHTVTLSVRLPAGSEISAGSAVPLLGNFTVFVIHR